MTAAIPEHVLKNAPWSVSKAGVIEKCGLQFDFKYIQKLKDDSYGRPALIGVAVHSVLELLLRKQEILAKKGAPPESYAPTALIDDALEQAKELHALAVDEFDELLTFRDNILKFCDRAARLKLKHRAKTQLLEQKWAIKSDFTSCDFLEKTGFFRGVVDYAIITEDNYMLVIDHKSGRTDKKLDTFDFQLRAYCVMACALIPELKGVTTAIHYVKTGELVFNDFIARKAIVRDFQPYVVNEIIKAAAKLEHPLEANAGWWCSWCGFQDKCPVAIEKARAKADK